VLILFFFFPNFLYAQRINEWKTVSLDKSLQFILSNNEGKLYYQVLSGNDIIVKPSRLGIEKADESFTDHLSLINATATTIDEHYTLKIGKKKINHANANGTSIEFKNNHNAIVYVDMRVYNVNSATYSADIFSDGDNTRDIKYIKTSYKKDQNVAMNVLSKGGFIVVLIPGDK